MPYLKSKRIVVTGGAGFLGKNVVAKLEEHGCEDIFVPRSKDYNLVDMDAVKRLYEDARPDIV
ncbi:MAG: NAD-dependent epimerase/dehydratase family protein, partial [Candidatus Methanoperedens sp.]|nr:NAD-dependent epimerase/dehydratase family protein [Candidatus Methanoperedens sp.]